MRHPFASGPLIASNQAMLSRSPAGAACLALARREV